MLDHWILIDRVGVTFLITSLKTSFFQLASFQMRKFNWNLFWQHFKFTKNPNILTIAFSFATEINNVHDPVVIFFIERDKASPALLHRRKNLHIHLTQSWRRDCKMWQFVTNLLFSKQFSSFHRNFGQWRGAQRPGQKLGQAWVWTTQKIAHFLFLPRNRDTPCHNWFAFRTLLWQFTMYFGQIFYKNENWIFAPNFPK